MSDKIQLVRTETRKSKFHGVKEYGVDHYTLCGLWLGEPPDYDGKFRPIGKGEPSCLKCKRTKDRIDILRPLKEADSSPN